MDDTSREDDATEQLDAATDVNDRVDATPITSTYKVLGQFDADDGVAVLGQNDADSGTPIGVLGATPNHPEGYGLFSPDDVAIAGDIETTVGHSLNVGGDPTLRLDSPDFDTNGSGVSYAIGGSVVGGYKGNFVGDVLGATIAGGGAERTKKKEGGLLTAPNKVTDRYGTVGGGAANQAGDARSGNENAVFATVGGGFDNTAGGPTSTVGGGRSNIASGGVATVGGGVGNDSRGDFATVGGGFDNTAHGNFATVGGGVGNRTGKSGTSKGKYATVPGGEDNVAREDYSFAAGYKAKAHHQGAFVWTDSRNQQFTSNGPDQFVIEADGGVGIGTNTPFAKLEVEKAAEGDAFNDPTKHVAIVDNTADSGSANALAIKAGTEDASGNLPTSTNFVSFYNKSGISYGAIQGNGSGGSEFKSTGSDYAEYLPKRDPDAAFSAGDVVGVSEGRLVADAAAADRAMVVSDQHIVLGNAPGPDDETDHEPVAFTGQVPARVRGPVQSGDLIVASDEADGTGRAVAPGAWRPADGPIVGQAWEESDTRGVDEVVVAVGIDDPAAIAADRDRIDRQRRRIERLERDNDRKADRIGDLEAENEELRTELSRKDERIAALEARLTAVETHLDMEETQATPADD